MLKKMQFFLMSKVLPPFLYIFLLLLRLTLRVEYINKSPLDDASSKGSGFIVCFWHSKTPHDALREKMGPHKGPHQPPQRW